MDNLDAKVSKVPMDTLEGSVQTETCKEPVDNSHVKLSKGNMVPSEEFVPSQNFMEVRVPTGQNYDRDEIPGEKENYDTEMLGLEGSADSDIGTTNMNDTNVIKVYVCKPAQRILLM